MDDPLPTSRVVSEPVARTIGAYDSIASHYAATWFDDSGMGAKLDRFLARVVPDGTVLDAGCGPGRDVLAMLRRGIDTVGIDLSRGMLREAASRVAIGIFRRMSISRLRYPSGVFAGVWACASVQHVTAPEAMQALQEFARVLEPGGTLFVTVEEGAGEHYDDFGRYRRLYSCDEFRDMVTTAGFTIIHEDRTSRDKSTLPNPRVKNWFEVLATKTTLASSSQYDGPACSCMLCPPDRFKLNREFGMSGASSILWGDDLIYAVPDLAPLTEGHLLLTATTHCTCYGAGGDKLLAQLQREQQCVRELLQRAYSKPAVFLEHGPARRHEAGSCIDHAHLHCMPLDRSVHETVDKVVGAGSKCSPAVLQNLYAAGQSYLYLEELDGFGYVYPLQVAPLQFLRQVAAKLTGNPNWRWQSSFRLDETRARFEKTISELIPLVDDAFLH